MSVLNRVLQNAALARLAKHIEYKAELASVTWVEVPAAYTSQRCHQCGHTARDNRESQAVFRCKGCGWSGNADTNAAVNVREDVKPAPSKRGHWCCPVSLNLCEPLFGGCNGEKPFYSAP